MQGRGRGQLSFHLAQPVTAASTITSVTYDDPNGSWESWEPGASWNGTGGAGHSDSDAPIGNAQTGSAAPHAQPANAEAGLHWDEDDVTNLPQPNSALPRTLITTSELDWEDTEELATELWRHPIRPRISRDQPAGLRMPARSPVRPDPRQLPMPLPGPGGARPHARSEEPTARLRTVGGNALARTGTRPTAAQPGVTTPPPQRLPAAPPPRLEPLESVEPERRSRRSTQPGAAAAEPPAALAAAQDSSMAMPEDWLDDSSPLHATDAAYSPSLAVSRLQPTAAGRYASPLPAARLIAPPASGSRAPVARELPPHASRRGSLIQTQAAGFGADPQLPPAPPPRPSLPVAPLTHTQSFGAQLPPAPPPRPSLAAEPLTHTQSFGAQLPPAPPPRPSLPVEPLNRTQSFDPQLPPAPPPRPSLPVEPLNRTQSFDAQLPPAPPPRSSLPVEPRTQSFEAHALPPPPPLRSPSPQIESLRERTMTPSRLMPPPPPRLIPPPASSAHIPTIIGTPGPVRARPEPQHSLAQSASRLPPRAAGRYADAGYGGEHGFSLPPQSHAQTQLVEQLQEQLLEAMARARVQEARAAEAESSVELVEEQLAAVARSHSEEAAQREQHLVQLSEQLRAAELRAQRSRHPDNLLHLAEPELAPRAHKQGRANLVLSGLLASSLSFGGAAYFMFYTPLQKQLTAVEQLRTQDTQAHATVVSNLQARSNAERQGLEAQVADARRQLDAARAEAQAAAATSTVEEGRHGRGRRGNSSAQADSPDGTPAGTRSARAIERRMRRSRGAAPADGADGETAKPRKSAPARGGRDDSNDPLGGI